MAMQSEKRINLEELARAQVGDTDQILGDLFDKSLDMEWNKEPASNNMRLHQQNKTSDAIIESKFRIPAYSEQLTPSHFLNLFIWRTQLISQPLNSGHCR